MNISSRTLSSVIACVGCACGTVRAQTLAPVYRARVLGELAGSSQYGMTRPAAISASGLSVGSSWEYGRPSRGWAWDGASMRFLQPPSGMEGAWTYASSVNADGTIAGTVEFEGRSYGAVWSASGAATLLDPLHAGESAGAAAINDSGLVTGGSWPGGIVWRNGGAGGASVLPLIDGATTGSAFLVNNSGTFAGYGAKPGQRAMPARWSERGGEWLTLPSEPAGAQDFVGTQLTGMNQRGDVIGWTTRLGFSGSGQLWRASGELVEVGDFDPENPGLVVPSGINDNAWVVGFRDVPGGAAGLGARGAFLWINGAMFTVADLIEGGAGMTLLTADAINNDGVIIGTAWTNDGIVPVLLTPVPSPGGIAGLVLAGVLVAVRRRR